MEKNFTVFDNLLKKFYSFLKQIGIILLYFILYIALQLYFLKDIHYGNLIITNLCYITIELIILTTFIFIFRKYVIPDLYDFKKSYKKYLNDNFIYYFIGLAVMVISNLIISSFIGLPNNEEANRTILEQLPIYSCIAMVIFAPIIEELMTRVLLKDTFKNKYIYFLFSGLIFGALHLTSITNKLEILYLLPYGALGFVFAMMYNKSNNIWTNITYHALHNFIAIALLFIGG